MSMSNMKQINPINEEEGKALKRIRGGKRKKKQNNKKEKKREICKRESLRERASLKVDKYISRKT